MKSYKQFIIEMTTKEAEAILGLNPMFTADELKAAYKKAAILHHPDRGGSEEMMKKVNAANDMLKKRAGSGSSGSSSGFDMSSFNARRDAMRTWVDVHGPILYQQMRDNFDVAAYKAHFEKFSGKKFDVIIEPLDFSPRGLRRMYDSHRIKLAVVIQDKAQETIIKLEFVTNWLEVLSAEEKKTSLGSGGAEFAYPLTLWMEAYHNQRNQKFKQRNWEFGKTHTIFTNPSELLPDAKMKKMFATGSTSGKANKPLKKADFKRTWVTKLGGSVSGEDWTFGEWTGPRDERKNLYVSRTTIFRKAGYRVVRISDESPNSFTTFHENQITMDMFLELGEAIKKAKTRESWIKKANTIIDKYAALTKEWLEKQ